MMASGLIPFIVRFFIFVFVSSQVSLSYSSVSHLNDGKITHHAVKGLFRNRRQVCTDGTYIHEGMTCCLCGAGLYLKRHCSVRSDDGECDVCEPGTYSSHPNSQQHCEPCTSCEHTNANLEAVEPCTRARNTKCQCKKGHYCSGGTEKCRICHPCEECGTEGIKVACTTTNNTICNEPITQGVNGPKIAGIIVSIVIFLIFVGLLVFFWRRRKIGSRNVSSAQPNNTASEVELLPIKDLHPYLPDIASILGWKDMKDIAMRSGISKTTIEACQLDHRGDSEEQTLQLLGVFVENKGRTASSTLIDMLRKSGKTDKTEKVIELLRRDDNAAPSDV